MKEDTSAIMEPTDLIGTVTGYEIDIYEGDWGDVTRLVLEMDNPNFENPTYRRWKFTRNEKAQIRKSCELSRMVLKPLKFKGHSIVDFDELKGLALHLVEDQLKYNIDGEDIVKDTWRVEGVYDSFDDAQAAWLAARDEEPAQEEEDEEPKKEAPKKKSGRKKKPGEDTAEVEDDADDEAESEDEPTGQDETPDLDLQSYVYTYLKGRPKRRVKKETIVAEVLKEFEVDDNEVHDALEALKKAKKVREPKFGNYQVM